MAEGKFFVIRSDMNGMVLDVSNNTAAAGTQVVMWPFHGGDNQLWYQDDINTCIRSKLDDKLVLEVCDGCLCLGEHNPYELMQRWSASENKIANSKNPTSVLDIADHNEEAGARVCAWDDNGGPNQSWSLEYQPPQYCYITSQMNGKVMDIKDNVSAPGAFLVMYDKDDDVIDSQLWYEDRDAVIRSKLNDCPIDIAGGKAITATNSHGWNMQQWIKVDYRIVSRLDPSVCLDIKGAKDKNGAKIISYDYKASDNQHWDFEYV